MSEAPPVMMATDVPRHRLGVPCGQDHSQLRITDLDQYMQNIIISTCGPLLGTKQPPVASGYHFGKRSSGYGAQLKDDVTSQRKASATIVWASEPDDPLVERSVHSVDRDPRHPCEAPALHAAMWEGLLLPFQRQESASCGAAPPPPTSFQDNGKSHPYVET